MSCGGMDCKEIAFIVLSKHIHDSIEMAKKNWTKEQVEMLERLFNALANGVEYKCIDCEYCYEDSGAILKECHWVPSEDEEKRPCEED